jgi:hypothetical protein
MDQFRSWYHFIPKLESVVKCAWDSFASIPLTLKLDLMLAFTWGVLKQIIPGILVSWGVVWASEIFKTYENCSKVQPRLRTTVFP